MKKVIGTVILISVIFFSCRKSSVKPVNTSNMDDNGLTGNTTGAVDTAHSISAIDSLNNVKGSIRLQLAKDTINSDNILINFTPNSQPAYLPGLDAPTLQGFGQVSLSSLSSNNVALSIYTLPLTKKGIKVPLRVNVQSDGIYTMKLKSLKSIPMAYDLWLMDRYKRDSVELRYNSTYAFNVYKTDTTSFGEHRFKLVIRTR